MTMILAVCTANICRSPVAEAALKAALDGTGIEVTSAGTHATTSSAMAPESMAYVRRTFDPPMPFRTRRLGRAGIASADLVLTMTLDQRNWVAREEPRAVRRTFTLLELARIVEALEPTARYHDLRDLAHDCARRRSRPPLVQGSYDIDDPYGGPPEGYEKAFALIHESCTRIAGAITRSVVAGPEHPAKVGREDENR